MNCEQCKNLMDGYLDRELDPITNQEIEQHLRDCRNCEQAYKAHGSLMRAIGDGAPYYKASATLRERVHLFLFTYPSRQIFLKFGARTSQPRHHRAWRNLRDFGYFLVRQTLLVAQRQDFPKFRRQVIHRLFD